MKWSEEAKEVLRKGYPTMKKEELLEHLPERTWKNIVDMANYMGVRRTIGAVYGAYEELDLKEEEKAQIAGIIDCDGYITGIYNKKSGVLTVRIGLANNCKELHLWLHLKIHLREVAYLDTSGWGKTYKSDKQGYSTLPVLKAIYPYLIVKRRQAGLAIKFMELRAKRYMNAPHTEEEFKLLEEVRRMNRSGIE